MEFFRPFTFLLVLLESLTLLPRNAKLLSFLSLLLLTLYSTLSFFRTSLHPSSPFPLSDPIAFLHIPTLTLSDSSAPAASSLPADLDFHSQFPDPIFPYLRRDVAVIFAVQVAFAIGFSVVSFFSTLSTLILAAASYKSRTLSLRGFLHASIHTCPRLFLTCLHAFSLTLGYFTVAAAIAAPLLIHFNFSSLSLILTGVFLLLLFHYLLVPLALSLAVTVVEENCYGLEALGKAAALVNGKRIHGFLLNVCFSGVVLGAIQIYKVTTSHHKGFLARAVAEIGAANVVFVMKIFMDIAYTVLYFHCKKERGEEIELYGSLQYDKLPAATLSGDEEEDGFL